MIRKIFVVAVSLMFSAAAFAGSEKIDLLLNFSNLAPQAKAQVLGKAYLPEEGLVSCLVKFNDADAAREAIEGVGGIVGVVLQNILTAQIPADAISDLGNVDAIEYIEAARPLSNKMDKVMTELAINTLHDGSAFGTAYKGAGAVVGLVDDSLDYGNVDFQNASGITRVMYIKSGTSECGRFGDETSLVTNNEDSPATCNIADGGGGRFHGTHVAGIAAGSDSTYTGVAPEADLIFYLNNASDADSSGSLSTVVLEGVSTIFSKADQLKKPAVANLSLGTSLGAHDGTSLLEQGLDQLTSNGSAKGRVVVNAAGNENLDLVVRPTLASYGGIHASINVTSGNYHAWRIHALDSNSDGTYVDIWLSTASSPSNCKIGVKAFAGRAVPAGNPSASVETTLVDFTSSSTSAENTDTQMLIALEEANSENNKPHAIIGIGPKSVSNAWRSNYSYDVVVQATGGDCTGDMWLYYDSVNYHDFMKGIDTLSNSTYGFDYQNGDSLKTITVPGTATHVITVGSYMKADPTWTDIDGTAHNQTNTLDPCCIGGTAGEISSFSSRGPTADGRTKPELLAPGEPIIATKASGASIETCRKANATHFKLEGSSMAAPVVSGLIAVLFSRNNGLTTSDVLTALLAGAPTSSAGTPKLTNAKSVLSAFSEDLSSFSRDGKLAWGGSSSSGGCGASMVPFASGIPAVAIMLLPALVFAIRRKRK